MEPNESNHAHAAQQDQKQDSTQPTVLSFYPEDQDIPDHNFSLPQTPPPHPTANFPNLYQDTPRYQDTQQRNFNETLQPRALNFETQSPIPLGNDTLNCYLDAARTLTTLSTPTPQEKPTSNFHDIVNRAAAQTPRYSPCFPTLKPWVQFVLQFKTCLLEKSPPNNTCHITYHTYMTILIPIDKIEGFKHAFLPKIKNICTCRKPWKEAKVYVTKTGPDAITINEQQSYAVAPA
jgi:hypothetical protein